jgi:hypothetical protein
MFELASRAYCEEQYDFARLLIQLAAEVLEHASEMDRSEEAQPRPRVACRKDSPPIPSAALPISLLKALGNVSALPVNPMSSLRGEIISADFRD